MRSQFLYGQIGLIFFHCLFDFNYGRKHTSFRHVTIYNGLKCPAENTFFEYNVRSFMVCTLICVGDVNCVGVFYSNSSTLCTGCGDFDADDLEESTSDTKYFYNCADTFTWSHFEGSYYKIFTTSMTFGQAKNNCHEHCGWLVHFDNTQEMEFVNNVARTTGVSNYAIGMKYNTDDSSWRWVKDNAEPTFTDWGPNEPNGALEYCVLAYGVYGLKWIDTTCNALPYVCEKELI